MAIAFGNLTAQASTGPNTSQSFSISPSGANLIGLFRACTNSDPGTISATWNGVTMTQIGTTQTVSTGGEFVALFYVVAPASGTYNVVYNTSNSVGKSMYAFWYTGVASSSPIDASAQADKGSVSSWSQAVTTTVANDWVIMVSGSKIGRAQTAGASTTMRSASTDANGDVFDSNAALAAGSNTLNGNVTSGPDTIGVIITSIKPFVSSFIPKIIIF